MAETKQTIVYSDLSTPLKVFVILGWIVVVLDLFIFITGFIQGWMSVI